MSRHWVLGQGINVNFLRCRNSTVLCFFNKSVLEMKVVYLGFGLKYSGRVAGRAETSMATC